MTTMGIMTLCLGAATASATTRVQIRGGAAVSTFDARFASVTYDIQDFIGFNIAPWDFDWQSARLKKMIEEMSPMTVRCGGTWEDGIFWEGGPRTGKFPNLKPGMFAHTLRAKEWAPFVEFMNSIKGVDLVVGLGSLWRKWGSCIDPPTDICPHDIPWDSANAAAFIKHNHDMGYKMWGYELGNEPAVWNYTWGSPIVTPRQHAADYLLLKNVLKQEYQGSEVPKVVGPDTTWGSVGDELPDGGRNPIPGKGGPNYDYWNATLQNNPAIDVAAFHYYAIQPGAVQSWRTFVNIARDGSMCSAVAAHGKDLASSPLAGKAPLWLGEGGASYGGFSRDVKGENWLRLFGGGISYLEDLACAASNGAQVFARQQLSNFITGRSVGTHTVYEAQPAWWVAVLWKKLVGTQAFGVEQVGGDAKLVHAFAFDGKGGAGGSSQKVVALINWDERTSRNQTVSIGGCKPGHSAAVYRLTPAGKIEDGDDDKNREPVESTGIAINGREARVTSDGAIPTGALEPVRIGCESDAAHVSLGALTAAFVVLE